MNKFIGKHAENLFVIAFLLIVLLAGVLVYQNTKLTVINQRMEHELVTAQNELNNHFFVNQALESGQWEEDGE